MNYQAIIDKYYPEDNELRHILITHSQSVARKALQIVSYHPELQLDAQFIEEAAMLHDLGIFMTDAPRHTVFRLAALHLSWTTGSTKCCARKDMSDMPAYASAIRVQASQKHRS